MTVLELIEHLRTLPQDSDVLVSTDEDATEIHPLGECSPGYYDASSGELHSEEEFFEYIDDDSDESIEVMHGVPVVVLYPDHSF